MTGSGARSDCAMRRPQSRPYQWIRTLPASLPGLRLAPQNLANVTWRLTTHDAALSCLPLSRRRRLPDRRGGDVALARAGAIDASGFALWLRPDLLAAGREEVPRAHA